MDGRVLRRSVTLADQLAAVGPPASAAGSCNLRDLLKLRDEDGGRRAVTLASAMQADRRASSSPPPSAVAAAAAARTLLDIIRDDQPAPAPGSYGGAGDPFVRRAVSLPAPQPASPPAPTRAVAAAPTPPPEASPPPDREEEGERVSLMALLEQTDRQWSAVAAAPSEQDPAAAASEQDAFVPEDDADLPEQAGRGAGAAGGGCCCVCMARAKGAAFIPCGHTFCRGCARELLAGRGRCPLCNAAIVDVLDIF
ncbi:putative E3 ubiquitin-protein ligase XBAT35 [Lolium rigidum]|uniref:putative E3 ubiquitin-protein ligase XBAT35 n=1 Tax=Lolium rigidum TaxID=89674 RepID=UPI001F5CE34A|nr:putative E3 ubiquitin-protein ligase XBAT35 [Lolium rigidum]